MAEKNKVSPISSNGTISPNGKIKPSQFEDFWKIYPNHAGKGSAKTKWKAICNWKGEECPTWKQIKSAILKQKKSDQWQDEKYIAHPSTWLNQQRWLDDPVAMKGSRIETDKKQSKTTIGSYNWAPIPENKYAQAIAKRDSEEKQNNKGER